MFIKSTKPTIKKRNQTGDNFITFVIMLIFIALFLTALINHVFNLNLQRFFN